MTEFLKTLIATTVGALIALVGTWYTSSQTAEKEYKAEMRGRLDQLMTSVVRSNKCFDVMSLTGQEPEDCEEQEPAWKSITLAELYFDNLKEEVKDFQGELLNARLAIAKCQSSESFDSEVESRRHRLTCVKDVLANRNSSGKLEKIFDKAKAEIANLKQ